MRLFVTSALTAMVLTAPTFADSHAGGYMASDLMSPCQEADNDARWGEAAETECEQYILGFVDALAATGMSGSGTEICPPEQNTADEVRWAFMRWLHEDFTKRKAMPASAALLSMLKSNFPCSQ